MRTKLQGKLAAAVFAVLLAAGPVRSFGQTNLNFTSISANVEGAIKLSWNSTSNEIYEVDYADSLIDTNTGTITWLPLYTDFPSQGTNTFIGDFGNYFQEPPIDHPSKSPMRFYRIALTGTNTANAPTATITSPTNGATVNGLVTVSVSSSASFPIKMVKLYVDGQLMPANADGTNFVINTCEWPNGAHVLFATVKTVSDFSGLPNPSTLPVYGSAASAYKTLNFDNLITRISFSEPFFEPSQGQTQQVSAVFAANVNWTLQIQNDASNTVRTATGSGGSMQFNWDGTGDGGTNIPDGNYTYLISAATNGAALSMMSLSSSFSSSATALSTDSDESTELWILDPDSSGPPLPLAIYPPGFDTNGFTIFDASQSEIRALTAAVTPRSRTSFSAFSMDSESGGTANALDANTPTSETSRAPSRPPTAPVKNFVGTFGIGYQTYATASGLFSTPPIQKTPPPIASYIPLDGRTQSQASQSETWGGIPENKDLGDSFIAGMKAKGWKMTVNRTENNISGSDLTGGTFNACNVALLSLHTSYATASELDGIFHTYVRFLNNGSPSYVKTDACSFGGSGTNGLKWLGFLSCNLLRDQNYNSMYNHSVLPINNDLHLLCSSKTFATAAPDIGKLWSGNMLGTTTTNGVAETVAQAWFDAGTKAYTDGETNHLVISFRVAGWPDAFSEHVTDINNTPGTGNQSDITKQDQTVFNNP